jgi:hypothetical protein
VLVARDAIDDSSVEDVVAQLVSRIQKYYSQIGVFIQDPYTIIPVDIPSSNLILGSPALKAVQKVVTTTNVSSGALHLFLVNQLGSATSTCKTDKDCGSGMCAMGKCDDPNIIGYSLGLPGPFDGHRANSAVLISVQSFAQGSNGLDLDRMAVTCTHEMGHFLGLYHTSEQKKPDGLVLNDPIPDTPEGNGSSSGPGSDNIMFWTGGTARTKFSAGQGTVVRQHALCAAPSATSGNTRDCGTCPAKTSCATYQGIASCLGSCSAGCSSNESCGQTDDGQQACLPN